MSNVVFVILISVLVASVAAAAVTLSRYCTAPACPACGSKRVIEEGPLNRCEACGETFP
jgi:transposase-like protein